MRFATRIARPLTLVLVAVTAIVAWAPSAWADTPTGAWSDPAPTTKVDNVPLAFLTKAQKLQGHADFGAGSIASVSFTLVQDAANTDPSDPCSATSAIKPQSIGGGGSHVDFAFDAPFPCNRKYEVRATVTPAKRTLQSDSPLLLNLWVGVAIPPATTSELTAQSLTGNDRGVAVHWASVAHEADFIGYEVRRAVGNGGFTPVADVAPGATSWTDHQIPHDGGTFRYQVVGMRPGPDAGTTVFADAGPVATATVGPAVATTTPAGGSSSGDPSAPGGAADGSGASGGGNGLNQSGLLPRGQGTTSVHQEFVLPGTTVNEPTTADTGFGQTLPFKKGGNGDQAAGTEDGAAVARLGSSGNDDTTRPRLLLVGGATTALSWAMLLRFLSRRAVAY